MRSFILCLTQLLTQITIDVRTTTKNQGISDRQIAKSHANSI